MFVCTKVNEMIMCENSIEFNTCFHHE